MWQKTKNLSFQEYLDTEAARLIEQQQAYQALARVISTAKEMMDTLLRSM